ncbi:MAG: TRAP transporter substrate-binding protein [Rhodospirillales bacterium]|nr:TRAP transporter substrate-binding protein [Rhodospirillales bacterium]QQS13304.1 MAG: TRAP transporter substrate-binding protein [Rhodospirillales bacterium]
MGSRIAILGAALLAAASLAPASAQERKPVELRYTTGAPAKTPWVTQLERFEKDVAEESKGALKIMPFIAAQLGNEQDTMQQVARGRIDMGGFSNGAVALVAPELALLGMPFYFQSIAEQDCVLDKHMAGPVAEALAKRGVKFLGWTEVGTGDIVGKKAFLTPTDVKGLKAAAASNKVSAMMWTTLGANPTPIGITEIASAFQTGLVDVNATVVTFYLPSGLAKVAPVLTRVELSDAPGIVLMNKAVYDKLPSDQRAMLDRAVARRPAELLRKEIRGFEEALRGMHVKAGGTIATVTPAQRELWRKALEPAWPAMVKEMGPEGDKFFKLMEAGRKACAKPA